MLRELRSRVLAMARRLGSSCVRKEIPQSPASGIDQARSEAYGQGHEAGYAEGIAQGRRSEQERIRSILTHEGALGRADLTKSLALSSDLDVESCIKALSIAPKEGRAGALFWKTWPADVGRRSTLRRLNRGARA